MEQLKLAYDLYNNSIYLNHLDKIENKEVLEIFKRINNRKELYLYILDLINDNDSAYSKRLKEWVYWEMGKDYYQELINAINDYLESLNNEYKDRKFGNIDGTKKERYEYLRKMNIRFEIDKLLEKNKI